MKRRLPAALAVAAAAVALAFLVLPIAAIFLRVPPGELLHQLTTPVVTDALIVSAKTSAIAQVLILLFGTPLAYLLASRRFRGHGLLVTLVELPLVLPPAVAGIALLAAIGGSLTFHTSAVVVALTFVAAPFYVRQGQAAFGAVDPSWLAASRTLGASEARTFARIAIPTAAPGLVAGGALAAGRALGEFGATLMFAGSLQGVTQTAPLAIYERFSSDFDDALALSGVLVAVSLAILLTAKLVGGWDAADRR